MVSPAHSAAAPRPWVALGVVALLSFVAQLALCQFFSFGLRVPASIDVEPSNLWKYAYQFPPTGEFLTVNWFGMPALPAPLNPFSLAANLPPWLFFTAYTPVIATLALLAMAAFLRELELTRPAALFGALIYAWQGDLLSFVFPGHYGYIGTWPFYALAAWGALRSARTGHWAYALVSGAGCGVMVGLQPDRGGIASLLIAALYLASAWRARPAWWRQLGHLVLCVAAALAIALAALLALFQSYIVGVSMGGEPNRAQTYNFDTQFSLGPEETLTYLVPGFFGWDSSSENGPYWGRVGQWPGWPAKHEGMRNLDLAISTTGTVAAALALLGAFLLFGSETDERPGAMSERQRFYGRLLLGLGAAGLVLAWGYHTPFYRLVFALPLMDKWRDPLKWLELTNFALITLSAFGVQHLGRMLAESETPELLRRRRHALWFLVAVLGLLFLGLLGSYPYAVGSVAGLEAAGYDPGAIAAIMSTIHVTLAIATASMAAACLLVGLVWRPGRLRAWQLENPWLHRTWQAILQPRRLPLTLALGLGALGVGQLAWVATQFIQPTDLSVLTDKNPLVEAILSEGPTVRVSLSVHDSLLNVLLQNQLNVRRVSSLDISAASRIPDALNAFFQALASDPARLWFLAGVKNRALPQSEFAAMRNDPKISANIERVDGYVLGPTPAPDLPTHALVRFRDYLAKATFIPGAEIIPSDEGQLARLKDPAWNPREAILLSAPASVPPSPATPAATADTPAALELGAYTSRKIDVEVQTPRPGYILINDAYDPDWEVTLNGRPAPLLRADFLLRAVAIPAGASSIVLHYVAHYRVAGLSLRAEVVNDFCDAFMLAAWIVAGVVLWRRRELDRLTVPDDALTGSP
jgi:hypothetical protein